MEKPLVNAKQFRNPASSFRRRSRASGEGSSNMWQNCVMEVTPSLRHYQEVVLAVKKKFAPVLRQLIK